MFCRNSLFLGVSRKKVDVCVLGGGPAGLAAALRAIDYKKKVCLIEKCRIGGADLWRGALHSKTLWEMAKFNRQLRGKLGFRAFGITADEVPEPDWVRVRRHLDQASTAREAQVAEQLKFAQIDVVYGEAKFADPHRIRVTASSAEDISMMGASDCTFGAPVISGDETVEIEADYYVIATGSQPRSHPMLPFQNLVHSSDTVMAEDLPKSCVIVGAGVIGCEFASIMANFGCTQVNIIEKRKRILPMEDDDVAEFIQNLLIRTGKVKVHNESSLESLGINPNGGAIDYSIKNKNDSIEKFTVDRALVCIGRTPKVEELNIEAAGLCLNPRGAIDVDRFQRCKSTAGRHIYACGDVTGGMALVNVGEIGGRACIDHMYGIKPESDYTQDFRNLSTILFLDQEVAAVGMNEQDCRKHNIAYRCARYGYEFVGRAVAMGNVRGFVKIIVTNDRKMQVLGVRAIGPHASSVVELASLAIANRESAYSLVQLRTAYPAITQGFQECLLMLLGRSTLKPGMFDSLSLSEWKPDHFERGRAYQDEGRQSC